MRKIVLFFAALLSAGAVLADARLPKFFTSNMVLQRDKPIPIWGWATAGETVTVHFHNQDKKIKAGKDGKWMIRLDPEPAGGPFDLLITAKNKISFGNVMVGEVWLCSGQSNMEMPIEGWGKINNYQQEIAAADYPMIRQIKIPNTISTEPAMDVRDCDWKVCSPQTAGNFSATAYFFARELFNRLHVAVGLINSSWGGTMVETWTSREAFQSDPAFSSMIESLPVMNMDSITKTRKKQALNRINTLQGGLDDAATIGKGFAGDEVDDSRWPKMKVPGMWEDQQLPDFDGGVWFRKTLVLSADDAGKAAMLDLSMIDDNDISYVNGVQVGATNGYNAPRHYSVPAGTLKEGKNIIAVYVVDNGGGGGIYGDTNAVSLNIGNKHIPLAGEWAFRVTKILGGDIGPNSYPTLLYNAMINPLIPYAIRGAIWYQGEANAGRAYEYRQSFPLMIKDWRKRWNEGDFPFYFVQLATFNAGNGTSEHGSTWAELREAQTMTLTLPNTGMAVTTDIGDPKDIHPKNKQDVGKRLAFIALHNVYGDSIVYTGPTFAGMQTTGNKVVVNFAHTDGGLKVIDRYGYLRGFEIAGADKKFYYAKATIDGDKVILENDAVSNPVAVRYAWADDASEANLFNGNGLPAVSFRTDQWPGITSGVKFQIGK